MVETSFNLFDTIVLGILVLSTLLSFFRGFVRELLSLGSWIGAMAVTVIYTPDLANAIKDSIDKGPGAALLVASAALFFGSKMAFSIVNLFLIKFLKTGKDVGLLDNFLGLGFGFLRAGLLLSLSYYVYSFVTTEENQPPFIAQSYTKPYVAQGAKLLEPMLKDLVKEMEPLAKEHMEQQRQNALDAAQNATPAEKEQMLKNVDPQDFQKLLQQFQQQQAEPKTP